MVNTICSLIRDESAAAAIEDGLIAGLIAVVIIGGATLLGDTINTLFTTISTTLTGVGAPEHATRRLPCPYGHGFGTGHEHRVPVAYRGRSAVICFDFGTVDDYIKRTGQRFPWPVPRRANFNRLWSRPSFLSGHRAIFCPCRPTRLASHRPKSPTVPNHKRTAFQCFKPSIRSPTCRNSSASPPPICSPLPRRWRSRGRVRSASRT